MRMALPNPTPLDLQFRLFGTNIRVHPFFWLMTLLMAEGLLREEDWPAKLSA